MKNSKHQHFSNKIFKLQDRQRLQRMINYWSFKNQTLVFTNGCFDILHRGHVDGLARAAELGDVLLVGLNTDQSVKRLKGQQRPLNKEEDRAMLLAGLSFVSAVVLFDEDTPRELIQAIKPNILVKGSDYSQEEIAGADLVRAHGGQVVSLPLLPGYSTTSLIHKIKKLPD